MSKIMAPCGRGIAIISLCLYSLAPAYAEEPRNRDSVLRFGIFLGGGYVDWVGEDANGSLPGLEQVPKPGFMAGLLTALDLSMLINLGVEPCQLAVQPELVYSTKGSKIELNGEDRKASTKMTYLQAGLLARAECGIWEKVTPYVLLGPELGFLRQAKYSNQFGDPVDVGDDFKSTDLGLIVGLGSLFSFPPWGAASLELRADLGLVSIDGQGDGDEIRNAALTLLVGYLY